MGRSGRNSRPVPHRAISRVTIKAPVFLTQFLRQNSGREEEEGAACVTHARVCLQAPSSRARSCKGAQVRVSSVPPMCTCTRVPACTRVCTALTGAKPGGRSPPRPRVPAQSRAAGGRRRLCSTRPVLFLLLPELRGSLSAVAVTHAGRQTPGEAREGCRPPLCRWLFVTSPSQVAVGAGRGTRDTAGLGLAASPSTHKEPGPWASAAAPYACEGSF